MTRKTIDRKTLIQSVNSALKVDETENPRNNVDFRQGIICAANSILHESGNYKGFGYLAPDDLDNTDNIPGVNHMFWEGTLDSAFLDTDKTRIYFL
jgi:hypothetical protein